jgi:PhnB protein
MTVAGIPRSAGDLVVALAVPDAEAAAAFYAQAFGAEEIARYVAARVETVHLRIAGAVIHVARSDRAERPSGTVITLYVENVDGALARAVAAGGRQASTPRDTTWGDRLALLEDPFGHTWGLACGIEEMTVEEHNRRWAERTKHGTPPHIVLSRRS